MYKGKRQHSKSNNKYRGKHFKTNTKKILERKIFVLILFSLLACMVTNSIAYLIKKGRISNEFTLGEVKAEINETFDLDKKIKKDVFIKNIGNIPIYIRTIVIVSWKDYEGKILQDVPEINFDYSIKYSDSQNWIKSNDGFYYYKISINPEENTDVLIEQCQQLKEYDDRFLEVSIANQAIQAEPSKAVEEAWKVVTMNDILVLEDKE